MGLEAHYDYTPRTYQRIVFAAAQGVSFRDAAEALAELCELKLPPKRVWRAAKRIGEERVQQSRQAAARYEELPLPAQRQSPSGQVPQVACVEMDGGRFQHRERVASEGSAAVPLESAADAREDGSWCEYKAGVLLSMVSQVHAEDPCPELPATFADPEKMRKIAREIKGFTHESAVSNAAEKEARPDRKEPIVGLPETLVKSVVATSGDVEAFGPLLAQAAYERGFHAAVRKAFVADGSSTNWGVWRRYFSHYTPILDFVHALMYVYAAALAGRTANEGWSFYREWSQWLWAGEVDRLLAALEQRQQELGVPAKKETGTPRAQLATSLGYLSNQRERMKYPEYRKQGLPLTSSPMESTIKQINRRIKGTEKFWSDGVDPMLQLVADRLSQTNVTAKFWSARLDGIINTVCCHQPA